VVALVLAAAGALVVPAPAALATDPAPVAHWKLDDGVGATAADDSASGLDASLSGPAWLTDGQYGGGLRFDGVDDRLDAPATDAFDLQELTVSLWVRANDPAEGAAIVTKGVRDCAVGSYGLYVKGNAFEVAIRDTYTGELRTLATSGYVDDVWDGRWHHISMTWDQIGGWLIAYADTRGVGRTPGTTQIPYSDMATRTLSVGALPAAEGCDAKPFAGDIDDARIYSHPLEQQQLAAMETPIPTATTLQTRTLRAYLMTCLTAVVTPAPRVGTVKVYELMEDNTERLAGSAATSWCSYPNPDPPQGTHLIPVEFERAGVHRLRAEFVPGLPWQPSSSVVVEQTVDRLPTETFVTPRPTLPGDPISILVEVGASDGTMTGSVTLYETTSGSLVEIETKALTRPSGYPVQSGAATFALAGRPKGSYSFEARYSGTEDLYEPSTGSKTLVVDNGITSAGPVLINNGAEYTNDYRVKVSAPAVGAVRVRLSNGDAAPSLENSYAPVLDWSITDSYDETDGLKTVHVQWQDDAGRWIPEQSDSIILDRVGATGAVSIEDGAAYTTSGTVRVAVPATDDRSGVTAVRLSNSGSSSATAWATYPYDPDVTWSLTNATYGGTSANGTKTLYVRWRDAAGNWSSTSRDTILLDATRPTVRGPVASLPSGATLGAASVPVKVSWSASDPTPGSGVARYTLQQRRFSYATDTWSTWTGATLPSASTTSVTPLLVPGYAYQFRAGAWDRAGNWSGWANGRSFELAARQETSSAFTYPGTWASQSVSGAYGGSVKYSTVPGATSRFSFVGRSVALVSDRGPARGKVALYLDGVYLATLDLYASTWRMRQIVYARNLSTSGSHVLLLKVLGARNSASTSARVDLDAGVVIR
jgi:hypothetical protein